MLIFSVIRMLGNIYAKVETDELNKMKYTSLVAFFLYKVSLHELKVKVWLSPPRAVLLRS